MSLRLSGNLKLRGDRVILRQQWQPMDADAAAYITAVEAADGQALEERVKIAIDNFVLGCKADGIWNAIKASCILAGARTLNGALVPLKGAAPTNFNFVSGDYNRKTGLVGNGSTKYLNSNRANNADPQNNQHLAVYRSAGDLATTQILIGTDGTATAGSSVLLIVAPSTYFTRSQTGTATSSTANPLGLVGITRSGSTEYTRRINGANFALGIVSGAPRSQAIAVFAAPVPDTYSNSRLAFYSIGESLDLALLDARVTALVNTLSSVIP